MQDLVLQIFLLLVGVFIELSVDIFLPTTKRKQLVRLLGFAIIIISITWIGYTIGKSRAENLPPSLHINESQRLDFETGINDSISLDICDAIPPTFYENCIRASSKLFLSNNSFTGNHSLGYQAELLPDVEQVFSVNIPINPPARVDAVSANIYMPNLEQPTKIWLLIRVHGEDSWKYSEISNLGGGWIYLYLDLQKTYDDNGLTVSQKGIDEVDIDVFLPKASQQLQQISIEIDDIELYFPSSQIFDTP